MAFPKPIGASIRSSTSTFKGISRGGRALSLLLEDVYVELKAVAEVPDGADTYSADERRPLAEAAARGKRDDPELRMELDALRVERWRSEGRAGHAQLQRRSIEDAVADPAKPGLVILGDPGSGKSTLLHHLAVRAERVMQAELVRLLDEQGLKLRERRLHVCIGHPGEPARAREAVEPASGLRVLG